MYRFSLLAIAICFAQMLFGQAGYWQPTNNPTGAAPRVINPKEYQVFELDIPQIQQSLLSAPERFTFGAVDQAVLIEVPSPSGKLERFYVLYAPLMTPEMAAQFPDTRTYAGWGLDDPAAKIRLDVTNWGFHAFVTGGDHGAWVVEPLYHGETQYYQTFMKKDHDHEDGDFHCGVEGAAKGKGNDLGDMDKMAGDCKLRRYRLALGCTGEYATYHGGTQAGVVAAMNTTMNRVNGVYENEVGATMVLVSNNTSLIYLTASTDPYTNTDGGTMLTEHQNNCTTIIGSANYDIGHVFSTGGGGIAGLGVICSSTNKGKGVTGSGAPIGDAFDIDYVAHEMGHQFGGNHTYNNSCGGNVNSSTAYETGSGSTIMAYAGICSPNVQNNSDAYFHAASLAEIATVIGATTCGVILNQTNTAPTAAAGLDYIVPHSTPLILSGVGTDINTSDTLTYCWEQMDNATATQAPLATNTGGPAFRSKYATTSNQRFLPPLANVIANSANTWEVLPSVARTMNFRLSVRDNQWAYGCTTQDNMLVTFNGATGPFAVTAPNTNVSWPIGSVQTVTWNVANSTAAPVSCANVEISLSTNGGLTYTTILLASTPNDGTEVITIPATLSLSTTARIRVKSVGNIFYDISNTNFALTQASNGFAMTGTPASVPVCAGAAGTSTLNVIQLGTFTGTVALTGASSNTGLTYSFASASVATGGNTVLTLNAGATLASGTYTVTVTGTSGTVLATTIINAVVSGAVSATTLTAPATGQVGTSTTPLLTWTAAAGATSYEIQVSTSSTFASTVLAPGASSNSYQVPSGLAANTLYYWRVRGKNACSTAPYSSVFTFTTANTICTTVTGTAGLPLAITATGTPTVTATLNFPAGGVISDVNVPNVSITHSYTSDLQVKLISPAGTQVTLFTGICSNNANFNLGLDDEATVAIVPCPPTTGLLYKPNTLLSALDGQNPSGTWSLQIADIADADGGSLTAWNVNICYSPLGPVTLSVLTNSSSTCSGTASGFVSAAASLGSAPYTYLWNNGATSASVSGLSAGSYTVTATDAAGNTGTAVASVSSIALPTLAYTSVNATGTSANGSINLTVTGAAGPFSYDWSNDGAETPDNDTEDLSAVVAGTYTVTVTTGQGCVKTLVATVNETVVINVALTATGACTGGPGGSATAVATLGTAPYSYLWNNGATANNITNQAAGTYTVTATDAVGNTGTGNIIIAPLISPTLAVSTTPANGTLSNGAINLTPTGGTTPYTYDWSNDGAETPDNDLQDLSGIAAGTYTVTTTGSNGCSAVLAATVSATQVVNLIVTATSVGSCYGGTGSTTAVATLGTAPYTYLWSNGAGTSTVTNLNAGTYTVTATDAVGNSGTSITTVFISTPPVLSYTTTNAAGATGSINLTVTGGLAPFTYDWSNDGAEAIDNDTEDLTALATGNYTVTVTSSAGCVATLVASVYCAQAGTVTDTWLNKFVFGTINNTSGNNGGFADYSNLSTSAALGATVSGSVVKGYTGLSQKVYYRIYADLNHDGDMIDTGERLVTKTYTAVTNNFTATIPTTALTGPTKLRVSFKTVAYVTNPCNPATYANGETEDYTLNITAVGANQPGTEFSLSSSQGLEAVLFPNPVSAMATLAFNSDKDAAATISIMGATGQKLQQLDADVFAGHNEVSFDTNNLPTGTYFVRLQLGDQVQTLRMVVSSK
jgi:subtilisin-like proprotein convertase family protein